MEIFTRLDTLDYNEIGKVVEKTEREMNEKFKDQIECEIRAFKEEEEDQILGLIEKVFYEKMNFSKNIKKVFNNNTGNSSHV